MNTYDKLYPCITKVLIYKQLNVPKLKDFTFKNYTCFDIFTILPNKKRLWEKWLVNNLTLKTIRHCVFYNKKSKVLINK